MQKNIEKCNYHRLCPELQPLGKAVREIAEQVGQTLGEFDNGSEVTAALAKVSELLNKSKVAAVEKTKPKKKAAT